MSDIALRVEGLGKRYRLGLQDNAGGGVYRYKSLRDSLGSVAKHPLRTLKDAVVRQPMDEDNSFWALKDVGFEVKKGEVVGIIGRNGAGKSTLLKVLSRITKPTTGRVDLFGRVGSLLEVGTGFHPELSGRENIYLNGAVLGMTRAEVKAKFDEIVAFSEVDKFLDTPVKQYSSGMYMRLAFAVAAHLEPEVLVIDEVLAVGDAAFQKKCLGKMKEVANIGRTVLLVSHNMGVVTRICDRAITFVNGTVQTMGRADEVVMAYLRETMGSSAQAGSMTRVGRSGLTLQGLWFEDTTGMVLRSLRFNTDYNLFAKVEAAHDSPAYGLVIQVQSGDGTLIGCINSVEEGLGLVAHIGIRTYRFSLRPLRLLPGEYVIGIALCTPAEAFMREDAYTTIEVHPTFIGAAEWAYNGGHGYCHLTDTAATTDDSVKNMTAGVA